MQYMPNITTEIKLMQSAKYSTQYLGVYNTWCMFQVFHSWGDSLLRQRHCHIYIQKTNVKCKSIRI